MSDRHGPHVLCCDGSGCDKARAPQTLWCDDHQPSGPHGIHYQAHGAPPWLADAAEALGRVRPSDGAPLALNWNQVLQEIRDLRDERDGWKANCESWHMVYNAWQDWSTDLLDGRQPGSDAIRGTENMSSCSGPNGEPEDPPCHACKELARAEGALRAFVRPPAPTSGATPAPRG